MNAKTSLVVFLSLSVAHGMQELKFVQIIFMHKRYAPFEDVIAESDLSLPSNDDLLYRYVGSMTKDIPKVAKMNMYKLGAYLRERYDEFLGDIYTSEIMRMRTTEFELSQISAQLVNAALWPPSKSQKWKEDFDWQPIPFEYSAMQKDPLLLGILCPRLKVEDFNEEENVRNTIWYHRPFFDYVSNRTGTNVTELWQIEYLYNVFETKVAYNLPIPDWANDVFPDGEMFNVMLLRYNSLYRTTVQRELGGGTFVKEIIVNALKYIQGNVTEKRKLVMYSGDDRNIVGILKAMNLWSPHIPSEATSLIFELYFNNRTTNYGMKINYYTGIHEENILLALPGCSEICPLDVFSSLVFNSIPIDEDSLCKSTNDSSDPTIASENGANDLSFRKWSSTMLLFILLTTFYT